MSELPKGWVEAELGSLADFVMGQAPPSSTCNHKGDGTPFVKAGEFGKIRPVIREWTTKPLKYARATDVLICVVGATAGKINLGVDCAIGRSVAAIRPTNVLYQRFLYCFLITKMQNLRTGSVGSAQGVISKANLSDLAFPLPPLTEQKRIVAKLDALSARSARARDALARIDTLVKRYKQAVLSKAFSGELTKDWRKSKAEPLGRLKALTDLCLSITDGDHQAPPKAVEGIPFITISAMNEGIIEIRKATRFVPHDYYEKLQENRRAKIGDVLFSVAGSYGIAAAVNSDRPFVFQRHIAIFRPDDGQLETRYLAAMLASPQIRSAADAIATGTAQKTVPLKGLRQIRIPAASVAEQREIVRRIESAFAKIDRLTAEAKRALALTDRLDEAILARAFRGELVPQDPNDEPASVLLERIRAERAAAPKTKRGRRKTA